MRAERHSLDGRSTVSAEDLPRYSEQEDVKEGRSFDDLARGLADGTLSRRRALKLFVGTLLGGSLLAIIPGAAGASEQSIGGDGGKGDGRNRRHSHHRRRRKRRRTSDGAG